mmetsp:Transcript_11361/g.47540  ORF Transcript_11361/g.47540 Transcript_11361/m.47540 type:complete len:85 (+) Transcript_11361:808-1062(+)
MRRDSRVFFLFFLSDGTSIYDTSVRARALSFQKITHALATCVVASAVSSRTNSELRNPDAFTSSLGAPILGVHSLRPVSGTTSS